MDQIRKIYSREVYDPFLEYCNRNDYHTMQDLTRFPFGPLALSQELPASLLNRVKTTFYMYCKKHPEIFHKECQKSSVNASEIMPKLEQYFTQNPDKLIHLSDVMRAAGNGHKRADVMSFLQQAKWCKVVDKSTFFYAPER